MTDQISTYVPPSNSLAIDGGIWRPKSVSQVSYPDEGNDLCLQIEEDSYWFAHRNRCILAAMNNHPPEGVVYDIGGGNGFVTLAMQKGGHQAVLVEPGNGANNGKKRGVRDVIMSTLDDCQFEDGSIAAAGVFDVVEHVEHDVDFLANIARVLKPNGVLYLTVPSLNLLWSGDDAYAGHFRRYSMPMLAERMSRAGFTVEYMTSLFAWLVPPLFALRAVPFFLSGGTAVPDAPVTASQDHSLPGWMSGVVGRIHQWELNTVRAGGTIPVGTSLLCVARKR